LWRLPECSFGMEVEAVPWGYSFVPGLRPSARIWRKLVSRLRRQILRSFVFPRVRSAIMSPRRRSMGSVPTDKTFYQALMRADVVISTGGHHIGAVLSPSVAISPQLFDMALAVIAGKKLALWSQSVGPLVFKSDRDRAFVARLLSQAHSIHVRDTESLEQLAALSAHLDSVHRTFDSVIALHDVVSYEPPSQRAPIFGVSVYASQKRAPNDHGHYVRSVAQIVDHAVSQGYTPRFFPMDVKQASGGDRDLICEILRHAQHGDECSVQEEDLDAISHIVEVSKCRMFLGHKTHSVIFALIAATPLIAIAYHDKTSDFMGQYDLSEFCIPERDCSGAKLVAMFRQAHERIDTIAQRESKESCEMSLAVRKDFRRMLTSI